MKKEEESNISKSLKSLEEIVSWFEDQENLDIEKGLEKVKQGSVIIKTLKKKLIMVQNEFNEVKKGLKD